MQRLLHDRPELRRKPVVICTPSPRGLVVLYRSVPNAAPRADVDANAREGSGRAIRPGMPLAEARSLQPDLHAEEIDPAAERRALKQVAESLGRFSPLVGLDYPSEQPGWQLTAGVALVVAGNVLALWPTPTGQA